MWKKDNVKGHYLQVDISEESERHSKSFGIKCDKDVLFYTIKIWRFSGGE